MDGASPHWHPSRRQARLFSEQEDTVDWPRNFFFYGTLMDPDVQRMVLGRPLEGGRPATIPGFAVRRVRGTAYPILCREPSSEAPGLFYGGLSEADAETLDIYEGWEYRREERKTELAEGGTAQADVYIPAARLETEERPWHLDVWQKEEKSAFLLVYFPASPAVL
jgi:ADP-ribose pyrophosphatase